MNSYKLNLIKGGTIMRVKEVFITIFILIFLCNYTNAEQKTVEFSKLTGPYLGQKLPKWIPEIFAPGVISSSGMKMHSPLVFSPDGTEVYWSTARPLTIYFMKMKNNKWTKPEIAPFAKGTECGNVAFSPDGKKLYFTKQIVENREDKKKIKFFMWLWYVEREGGGWTKAKKVKSNLNDGSLGTQISFSKNGTLYFTKRKIDNKRREENIYYSKLMNGEFTQPVKLSSSINTELEEGRVYISPDESYILFVRGKRVKKPMGLYLDFFISYKKKDGSWTKAKEIGDLLGEKTTSGFIGVSPDGKSIFFTSFYQGRSSNMYWVSSALIDFLKPKDLK
jgi:Tol biopolymer transport system component